METKRLTRSRDKKLGGVCGGLAEYLELDATVIRAIWLLLVVAGGTGLVAYLVLWIVMPEQKVSYEDRMNERLGRR